MTSRELVINTLNHQPVPRAPRDLWVSPYVETSRPDDLAEVTLRFPSDVVWVEARPAGKRAAKTADDGTIVDEWGCRCPADAWAPLVDAQDPPLATASKIASYSPPKEAVDASRFAKVSKAVAGQTRFAMGQSEVRPFERLQALRGSKAALVDLARDTKEIRKLLTQIHEVNCRELELWAATDVDGVAFRDVWGSDDALVVAPAMWRDIFKPLYRDYCQILHGGDKFALFITGGNVFDILSDLVKIEVDAVHSQWAAMNLDRTAKRFRGRITFWGGLDRPAVLTTGKADDVRPCVERVRQAFDFGAGGVVAQCPWEMDAPLGTLAAFHEQWQMSMPMHAQ